MRCKDKAIVIYMSVIIVCVLCACQKNDGKVFSSETHFDENQNKVGYDESENNSMNIERRKVLFENEIESLFIFEDETREGIINVAYKDDIIQIEADYQNIYEEKPEAILSDLDEDGEDEIILSVRRYTGSMTTYDLYMIDKKEEWKIISVLDINNIISPDMHYEYDENEKRLVFNCGNDSVELLLPEWSEEFPFSGNVEYDKRYRYDLEEASVEVVPYINMENSLPITDLSIFYCIDYNNDSVSFSFDHFAMHKNETDFWYVE